MYISNSNISMQGDSNKVKSSFINEKLDFWFGRRPSENDSTENAENQANSADKLTLSDFMFASMLPIQSKINDLTEDLNNISEKVQNNKAEKGDAEKTDEEKELEEDRALDPQLRILKYMFRQLYGEKFKISISDYTDAQAKVERQAQENAEAEPNWGLEYSRKEVQYEKNEMSFAAKGVVKTADGRAISFDLQIAVSNEFLSESNLNIQMGNAVMKDPLVINFDGNSAELTDSKFNFDLDTDGAADNISFLKSGSGFLVYDKNQDGIINDGSEMFGAKTGNGFEELAEYDADSNGWLDEIDTVYNALQIWTKENDTDMLSTLKVQNIGAIYLGSITTPYELRTTQNALQGQTISSGVYLKEDGTPGTIQQIDLVV